MGSLCSNGTKTRLGKRHLLISSSLLLALIGLTLVCPRSIPIQDNSSHVDLMTWGDASCYSYTGGTCSLLACNTWRNSHCVSGACVCSPGACSSGNGTCVNATNEEEASHFTLRNVKWPKYYLQYPHDAFHTQLRVTSEKASASQFNLYKSASQSNLRVRSHYLEPVDFPQYAVTVSRSRFPQEQVHEVSLKPRLNLANSYAPADLLSYICRPLDHPDALRIDMAGAYTMYPAQWWNVGNPNKVFGWSTGDIRGEESYWIPEPQINVSFPNC